MSPLQLLVLVAAITIIVGGVVGSVSAVAQGLTLLAIGLLCKFIFKLP